MNLVIDIGNTRTKISIYKNNIEIFYESFQEFEIGDLLKIANDFSSIQNTIISTTSFYNKALINEIRKITNTCIEFSSSTPLPFKTEYRTPETIGLDRLAAIAGAQSLRPGSNVLVIDAGTAITYDLITANQIHRGGNISPGMMMRFKALNTFTHSLPMVEPQPCLSTLGLSTNEAILNGVIAGIIKEMNGYINDFNLIYEDLTVLLTGGDAEFFEIKLKNSIFVVQNLVQTGLNIILKYNVETN
jgi:type III pantothenate kinase